MADHGTVQCTAGEQTLLTPDAVTGLVTFQNKTRGRVWLSATVGATPPTDRDGAILFVSGRGERTFQMEELFPGLSGANRLYVEAEETGGVFISYA